MSYNAAMTDISRVNIRFSKDEQELLAEIVRRVEERTQGEASFSSIIKALMGFRKKAHLIKPEDRAYLSGGKAQDHGPFSADDPILKPVAGGKRKSKG